MRGRILYRDADRQPFIVLRHDPSHRFFVSEDAWTNESTCAGPFEPSDVLRAWRIANVRVPEGCERGPWQWGIAMFSPESLPHPSEEWSRFDTAWLPPSVSIYSDADIDKVVNETCCAPPHDEPHVDWGASLSHDLNDARELATAHLNPTHAQKVGLLQRAWNAHPVGSLVVRTTSISDAVFVVVDLPA